MIFYLFPFFNPLSSICHHLKHSVSESPMEKAIWLARMVQHICEKRNMLLILCFDVKGKKGNKNKKGIPA